MSLDMYWEHLKKTIKEEHLLQQIFYPDETRLKFKREVEVVMAQYKMVYKNTRKKAKQSFESYSWILRSPSQPRYGHALHNDI